MLNNDDHGFINSLVVEGLENLSVSFLIKADNTWDVELIDSLFIDFNKHKILSLPLSSHANHNIIHWNHERTGVYTVKLAYRMLQTDTGN